MVYTMEIPNEYGWVVLGAGVGPFICGVMLSGSVMSAREKYNVPYPNLYAVPGYHKDCDAFNRIQRGHQNFLENLGTYVTLTLLGGLKHPLACAIGSVLYWIGSVLYQKGYADTSVDAAKARHMKGGPVKYIGLLTSLYSTCALAYGMITA
mmetsp:Transcript_42638/g.102820  ORF Transcript_42638/g.102820 Transcript_42638/m.102820 type:complete len:151 (+) Transcript_42638:136-588(+)